MNEIFPEICSGALGNAAAGALALIPHEDGPFLALVTEESVQNNVRSVVILNLNQPHQPQVVLHDNWGIGHGCLYYKSPMRFEISDKKCDVGTNAKWWRNVGVIASMQNDFFIRAAAVSRHSFSYVNIRTGAVLNDTLPNFYATFGVWSIWLRDPLRERSVSLFDFDIHKQS